ncbi:flagellar hook-length control protein FliK [Halomonas urumqiensis]|uniref:Flagellar hook-length control protein-like C-terminal domain-containing protein n=1 Tax=Halomonas urumqiensis TaxID=1684789 RepID=A0A2N7UK80_9GAMM|nr:flagellar hook-length control protein FliK [Halomonas urumqiensis]PMR80847.1 hypothetical protein C1H70_07220 [Halomonas urumqiensis]PTB02804.1 flagellar hook-length control protein FliK [Halomonas urumqiensis]GHE21312.1 hypothetical protein GCM10017767_18330 [Halomonas urumqiensis]
MSGINPLIDTLMHQVLGKRVDTPPPRDLNEPVRPMSAADAPRALHSDSRLDARARQLILPASAPAQRQADGQMPMARSAGDAPPSTQLHLTASARSIADLLLRFPAPPSVVKPPLPLVAAGQSPAPAQLAERLQGSVRDSGLFYEAHLARWYRGEMPREQLQREPQMWRTLTFTPAPAGRDASSPLHVVGWGTMAASGNRQMAPGGFPGQAVATAMRHDTNVAGPGLARAMLVATPPAPDGLRMGVGNPGPVIPGPVTHGHVGSDPGNHRPGNLPPGAGSHAAPGSGAASPSPPSPLSSPATPVSGQTGGETREGAAAQESRAALAEGALRVVREPIHESLQGIVRHQLEMLVTPVLRWEGDVWTGIFMALVMPFPQPEREGQGEQGDQNDEREKQGWRSEMTLDVDGFGRVGVNLWLRGERLDLNLSAHDVVIQRELENGLPRLVSRLKGNGLADVRARVVATQESG